MNNTKKQYKALITDVDGTLVANHQDALPTERVKEAISKASKKIHIGIATSRPLFYIKPIQESLPLNGPSIINGGSQIIDFKTGKILWEKLIERQDIYKLAKIASDFKVPLLIHDNGQDLTYTKKYLPNKPVNVLFNALESDLADQIRSRIEKDISTLSAHKIPSWVKGKFGIVLNHVLATKQHGVFEVAKILGIDTHEIIGVGDGGNDFPLLMACGLKVAMGNASEDLKAIADYIAPTVEEDGLADVIEKFVLN